jgi:hypothetical protein
MLAVKMLAQKEKGNKRKCNGEKWTYGAPWANATTQLVPNGRNHAQGAESTVFSRLHSDNELLSHVDWSNCKRMNLPTKVS